MKFKAIVIDGIKVFYREAGDVGRPKMLLLHGFPSSSHQYRNAIAAFEGQFHIIAPDYPGFGYSDIPDPKQHAYSFDNMAEIIEKMLEELDFRKFGMYVQDYGGPVGFRIVGKHPDWLEWLIIQNTNAFEVGFTAAWDSLRSAFWLHRTPDSERAIAKFLTPEIVQAVYTTGHPDPELVSPDNWNMDNHFLERPNAKEVQLDLLYDYRKNVELYPKWQEYLSQHQPKTIIFWGQGDIFFTPAGGEAYLKLLPNAEIHRLNSGHFALEDNLTLIATKMMAFYDRIVVRQAACANNN